ncbi:MAG: hypothetical protein J1F61_03300 [Clostridiales bacterium]|nr:hypothetical protein [Clostridiales bacterium]
MFETLARNITALAAKASFDSLVWLVWGSFIAIFILALTLCLCLPAVRSSSKRPYLCLLYAYTAVTFALFLTVNEVEQAAFIACIFWICGYFGYGLLCAASRKKKRKSPALPAQVAACAAPALPAQTLSPAKSAPAAQKPSRPAPGTATARNNVRLDHALAVTGKLLEKNIGKTDRQELEKLKNTFTVMKVKGSLTPAEGEILNENFNALLKLMAKYNI